MIRYLSQGEKYKSRNLWKEAFPEDSVQFDDYYYAEKIKDNLILVKELDGEIVSMAHRNPYQTVVKDKLWTVDYVVGVATAAVQRKRGHMRDILSRMLSDMYGEGMPFCYLMPAAEAIYLPFGFTYIFDQPKWRLVEQVGLESRVADLSSEDICRQVGEWQNQWLSSWYQVYSYRSIDYTRQLGSEISSEAGTMELLYLDGMLAGTRSTWGFEKKEQRALLCDENIRATVAEPKPAIMARIVNAGKFMEAITLREEAPMERLEVMIGIEDEFIEENNGVFLWTLERASSGLRRMKEDGHASFLSAAMTLHVSQLTSWLFGYRTLTELLKKDTILPEWCGHVQVLEGVFLDEIV